MVSGDVCSPCQPLKPHLRADAAAAKMPGLRAGWSGEGLALLLRDQNEGMDFAAHNVRPTFDPLTPLTRACLSLQPKSTSGADASKTAESLVDK